MTDSVCPDCGMWEAAHTDQHLAQVCLPSIVRRLNLQNGVMRKALEKYINVFLPGGVCPANEVFQPGGVCAEKKNASCEVVKSGKCSFYCEEYEKTSHDHSPTCYFAEKRTEPMQMNRDPKWIEKMAKIEMEAGGNVSAGCIEKPKCGVVIGEDPRFVKCGLDLPCPDHTEKRERPERNAKCGACGHEFESHDYSGCMCWIDAGPNKCPCKVFKD